MGIGPVWTLERLRIQSKRSSVASEGFWLGSVTIARGGGGCDWQAVAGDTGRMGHRMARAWQAGE